MSIETRFKRTTIIGGAFPTRSAKTQNRAEVEERSGFSKLAPNSKKHLSADISQARTRNLCPWSACLNPTLAGATRPEETSTVETRSIAQWLEKSTEWKRVGLSFPI